nr:hypothetical protein [Tanacetum cinerariifolium]
MAYGSIPNSLDEYLQMGATTAQEQHRDDDHVRTHEESMQVTQEIISRTSHLRWMSFSKRPGKNTPQCYTKPLDSLKNWNNRFFWVDEIVFQTVVDWRTNASKDEMPAESTYSIEAVRALDTHRTPIQKQPEMLLCLVEISRRYYLGDEVYKTNYCPLIADMDLFNLIRAPNTTKVKTGSRPRAPHEVPLLTLTATRVNEMDDPVAVTDSDAAVPATDAPGAGQAEETAATDPPAAPESRKRGRDRTDVNAPPKSLRRDHSDPRPSGSSRGRKSLAAIQLGLASTVFVPEDAPAGVSDLDPLSFTDPPSRYPTDVAHLLDTLEAYQDLVDHVAPPGYFFELRHMHNEEFLRQYNVARRDKRIQARELEIKNLEALLEAETNTKKAVENKSAGLSQDLENMRAWFSDLQVSNERLSQQVATLQQQVSGEEKLKAAFEEFKRHQDDRVEQRCAEIEARLDALSIDFDEELYADMLTTIAGRRWVIGRGLRLAVMKCDESLELRQAFADVVSTWIAKGLSESLRHGLEHGQAQLSLESIEEYDPEAKAKFVAALQALKDLKYPLVDQLKGLKDAPMEVIMAALYLESDTGDDAPYHAEKKKKCRIVCRTHGVGSAHHARSDGIPVSVPTVVPQGPALLLADAATQTELENDT